MVRVKLACLGGLLLVGLTGCATIAEPAPTPSQSTASPRATSTAPSRSPSARPTPTPSSSNSDYGTDSNILAELHYRSGELANQHADFRVTPSGYSVGYTCDAVTSVPNDSLYEISNAAGTVLARRDLQCDGKLHTKRVPESEVQRAGTANTILTVTLPGDLQGIEAADIIVRDFVV